MRKRFVVALVAALMAAGTLTAFAADTTAGVSCTITGNTLSCPLPAPPAPVTETATVTETPAQVTVTQDPVTVTVTVSPTTVAPTTSDASTPSPTPPATTTSTPPPAAGWPDATNTGVPAGTTLTPYAGPMTITTNGTVIDSATITGDLRIKAKDVVVKRSKIKGDVRIDSEDAGFSFRIEDSEVDAGPANGSNSFDGTGIGARDFTAIRVHVYNGKRSVNCYLNCTIQDSYVHGQAVAKNNEHQSGIRLGANSTLLHNTIACDAPDTGVDGGCSAPITGYGDFAQVRDVLVQGNHILATSGGVCAYAGSTNGKPYPQADNVRYINNVFGQRTAKDPSQHTSPYSCGYYADIFGWNPEPGSELSGNVYENGKPLAYVGR